MSLVDNGRRGLSGGFSCVVLDRAARGKERRLPNWAAGTDGNDREERREERQNRSQVV